MVAPCAGAAGGRRIRERARHLELETSAEVDSPRSVARPGRVFYGWWIVAAAFTIQALINGLFMSAFGSYNLLLRREFGWSKTALSTGFSLMQATSGVSGPAQGFMTDRFGPRAVVRVGVVTMGTGLLLLSQVHSLPGLFASLIVIAAGSSLAGYLSLSVAVVNWFTRRRAVALGMVSLGFAAGGFASRATAWGLESYGWREVAVATAILTTVLGLLAAQVIRTRPEDMGLHADGSSGRGAYGTVAGRAPAVSDEPDFTLREALRTRQFWYIAGGHGAALLVVATVQVHMVEHLAERLDYTIGGAASIWVLLTAVQAAGMLTGGYLADRLTKRGVAAFCMVVHAGALLTLAFASSTWMVIGFAIGHGWAWGTRGPLMSAIRADYFGRRSFGTIMGVSQPLIMIGMTGGPILSGYFADVTGGYETGFTVLAGLAALGSVFFLLASRPTAPQRVEGAAGSGHFPVG